MPKFWEVRDHDVDDGAYCEGRFHSLSEALEFLDGLWDGSAHLDLVEVTEVLISTKPKAI